MAAKQYCASIPEDDPRFADLRAALDSAQGRGRYSPAPRMLAEWALLGFLLVNGKIAMGSGESDDLSAARADHQARQAARQHVAQALGGLEWE